MFSRRVNRGLLYTRYKELHPVGEDGREEDKVLYVAEDGKIKEKAKEKKKKKYFQRERS